MDNSNLPKATHEGIIDINGIEIRCYNLSTGERVLSREGLLRAIGRKGNPKFKEESDLFQVPVFLRANNLKPFISNDLVASSQHIKFKLKGGQEAYGYLANILPEVCYVFIDADKEGKLKPTQKNYVEQAEKLIRGFATLGIIALVDEATGYQYDREAKELQKILKAYISNELLPWQKRFPDMFYKEIFRLNGWDYTVSDIKKRPGVIGIWTNKLIYRQLPKGVLRELKSKTPKNEKGTRKARFHQLLTLDIGHPDLQRQLASVITIMQLSKNWKDFELNFNKLYGQQTLDFNIDNDNEVKKETKLSDFNQKLKQGLNYNPKND